MAKIPDFSELTKKLGIDGIVGSVKDSVKSVMSGTSAKPAQADEVVAKIAELSVIIQALSKHHSELGRLVADVQNKFNTLVKDLQSLQEQAQQAESVVTETTVVETTKTVKDKATPPPEVTELPVKDEHSDKPE